jgi:hypothetical protein
MSELRDAVQAEIAAYRPDTVPPFDGLYRRRRRRRVKRAATLAVAACLAGAAAAFAISPPDDRREQGIVDQTPAPGERVVQCGTGPAFPVSALTKPATAERDANPAAEALRAFLAEAEGHPEFSTVARRGYVELVRDDLRALYATRDLKNVVFLENRADGWRQSGVARGCQLTVQAPSGTAVGTWYTTKPVFPADRSFVAMVEERSCASGNPPTGRIEPPRIEYGETTVTVTFFIRRLTSATCPGAPPAPYEVVLKEPLGDRRLLDGHRYPPVTPSPFSR